MKRLLLGIMMMVLILSCQIPVTMAETPTAEAPPMKSILVADFEESNPDVQVYNGSASKISFEFAADVVHDGKVSVLVKTQLNDWALALYNLPEGKNDWTGMTTFKMWVYGSGSKYAYDVEIQDNDQELLMYVLKDTWTGWQQVVIPLNKFKRRSDYQDSKAKLNGKIDYPLKTIQFFNVNNASCGNKPFSIYFDQFEVTNE